MSCSQTWALAADEAAWLQVDECNSNRLKMMAEAAESSTAVKVLVVKVCYRQRFLLNHQPGLWVAQKQKRKLWKEKRKSY